MKQLVLVRHGESAWNQENRFTGWVDVGLSEKGVAEAREAGRLMKKAGLTFDLGFTSVLRRAILTLDLALDEMNLLWIPVEKHWRLNERHYGGLQGLNKAEMAANHGEEQVRIWRRSFDVRPPALDRWDPAWPGNDARYEAGVMPKAESLKDTIDRVLPFWRESIAPAVQAGRRVIVGAHGNSLRALVKHLDGISDADIVGLEIATGAPIVYELDGDLRPVGKRSLR